MVPGFLDEFRLFPTGSGSFCMYPIALDSSTWFESFAFDFQIVWLLQISNDSKGFGDSYALISRWRYVAVSKWLGMHADTPPFDVPHPVLFPRGCLLPCQAKNLWAWDIVLHHCCCCLPPVHTLAGHFEAVSLQWNWTAQPWFYSAQPENVLWQRSPDRGPRQ